MFVINGLIQLIKSALQDCMHNFTLYFWLPVVVHYSLYFLCNIQALSLSANFLLYCPCEHLPYFSQYFVSFIVMSLRKILIHISSFG